MNGAFRAQRVTGQQRYASNIAAELCKHGLWEQRPPAVVDRLGSAAAWAWCLGYLPVKARGDVLVSLTARAPVAVRRHIVTIHDLFPLTHPEWYSGRYVAVHRRLLERHLETASTLVAVSEPAAAELRSRSAARVIVAPNAASAFVSDSSDAIRAGRYPAPWGPGRRFLLTVGSVDPRKNVARLAAAYEGLPQDFIAEHPLVIVGGSHAAFGEVDAGLPAGCFHLGYVTDDELAALYRDCHAFVYPSLDEGFGLPLVEALAAGVQRFALSDIPVFRWIMGVVDQEFFDPADVDAMRAALLRLADRPALSPTMRNAILSRFSWEASAAAIYEEVLRLRDGA